MASQLAHRSLTAMSVSSTLVASQRRFVQAQLARRQLRLAPTQRRAESKAVGPRSRRGFHHLAQRRSTTAGSAQESRNGAQQASFASRSTFLGIAAVVIGGCGYLYVTDTRASFHRWLVVPLIRWMFPDAEDAHKAGIVALKALSIFKLNPRERGEQDGGLNVEVFGQKLNNPLAVSAGLDKNGDIIDQLFDLGPAIVEIGGITPLPQPGNERPRVWRVVSQDALINRYGLNSKGATHIARQLRQRVREFASAHGFGYDEAAEKKVLNGEAGVPAGSLRPGRLLAIQIAKNKATPDNDFEAIKGDYVKCVQQLGEFADIIVVNVSSPNTPGLRNLQQAEPLKIILNGVVQAAQAVDRTSKPKVMVKVSPDEDGEDDVMGICEAVWDSKVDGVIVANTTRQRPLVSEAITADESKTLQEMGGYSGPALFQKTRTLVERYRESLDAPLLQGGEMGVPKTIFASGGICSGEDVLKVCNAGASVAMSYTAMSYQGSGYFTSLKKQIRDKIQQLMLS